MATEGRVEADSDGYLYDAFISYRHTSPDRSWATWLHSALERYRLPKRFAEERKLPRRLSRVFRDEEEVRASASLSDEIERALVASRFLIVVCSPRVRESRWINAEIARFRELGRGARILALLIEGDPAESFPPALRLAHPPVADESAIFDIGEPLAPDVRRRPEISRRASRRIALLRFLATMHGVQFDDLRQRDQERRNRTLLSAAIVSLLLGVGFATLGAFAYMQRAAAIAARDQAEERLANRLMAESDALRQTDRWREARARLAEAAAVSIQRGARLLPIDLRTLDLDLEAPTPLSTWPASNGMIDDVVALADGRLAVAVSRDGTLRKWDLRTQTLLDVHEASPASSEDPYLRTVLSDDGRLAALARWSGQITVVEVESGRPIATMRGDEEPWALAFSPNGRQLAVGSMNGILLADDRPRQGPLPVVRLWDVSSGEQVRVFVENGMIGAVAFSPDGRVVATSTAREFKSIVGLWDVETGDSIRSVQLTGDATVGAPALAFSPDGTLLAQPDQKGVLHLWSVTNGMEQLQLQPAGVVTALKFSRDGRWLASGGANGIAVWNIGTKQRLAVLVGDGGIPSSMDFVPQTDLLLDASAIGFLSVWNATARDEARRLDAGTDETAEVSVSSAAPIAMTSNVNGGARMWDLATGKPLVLPSGDELVGSTFAFFSDGQRALGLDVLLEWRVWDLVNARLLRHAASSSTAEISGQQFPIEVRIDEPRNVALAALMDGRGLVLPLDGEREAVAMGELKSSRQRARLSPNGDTLLVLDDKGGLDSWSTLTAEKRRHYDVEPNGTDVAISPDGQLAFLALPGRVEALDLDDGEIVAPSFESQAVVRRLALSLDGSLLAAATGVLRVWDVSSRRELYTFASTGSSLNEVAFSGDGKAILSSTEDGEVRVLDLTRPEKLRQGRSAATAAFEELRHSPRNANSVATLGHWYALRGAWLWAADLLADARTRGATVDPLTLARAYWMDKRPDLAADEFGRSDATAEAPQVYLDMCRTAAAADVLGWATKAVNERSYGFALYAAERAATLLPRDVWLSPYAHYLAARLSVVLTADALFSAPDGASCSPASTVVDHLSAALADSATLREKFAEDSLFAFLRDQPVLRGFYACFDLEAPSASDAPSLLKP